MPDQSHDLAPEEWAYIQKLIRELLTHGFGEFSLGVQNHRPVRINKDATYALPKTKKPD